MPTYEVQLIRRYQNHDTAFVEVEADTPDDAIEAARIRSLDPDLDWSEGDDYDMNEIEVGEPEEI